MATVPAQSTEEEPKPLARSVDLAGVIVASAYLVLLSLSVLYALVRFWLAPAEGTPAKIPDVQFLVWEFPLSEEGRLFAVVALAGAAGALVHSMRSFWWYVGNRNLKWSWLIKYLLEPIAGAALATVFYLALRGGLFSAEATPEQTNPFGFAALAGLVGMFSDQASEKLKLVAEQVFEKMKPGSNHTPPPPPKREQPNPPASP